MNQVNFLPESYVRQQAQRQRAGRQAVLIAAAVLCLVGWWVGQRSQTAMLRQQAEAIEARASAARAQMTELAALEMEHRQLVRQVNLQRELAQPVNHTQVLATMADLLPRSVALLELTMHTRRPAPEPKRTPEEAKKHAETRKGKGKEQKQAEPDRIEMELLAIAPDNMTVAQVIGVLDGHPLFDDVMLRHSREIEVQGVHGRHFRLLMTVELSRQYRPKSPAADGGGGIARAD